MTGKRTSIAVLGTGAWGTALAISLSAAGHDVTLWGRKAALAEQMRAQRENSRYLPGIRLPERVTVTSNLDDAFAPRPAVVVLAVPSQHLRGVLRSLAPYIERAPIVVNAAKGLDRSTGARLSTVIADAVPAVAERIVVLSGPNHAEEVGRGIPTATVISGKRAEHLTTVQQLFMTDSLRVYTNPDLIGVELGGALKNVIALASGISDGLGYGDNSKAALVTRGLAEMARLGIHLGADALTFSGLAGMGDLVATATSDHSRNVRAGRRIGAGERADDVVANFPYAIEGIPTAVAAFELAGRLGVDMPITEMVYEMISGAVAPAEAVSRLMSRGPTSEVESLKLSPS